MNRALTLVFLALCITVSAQIPGSGLIGSWPFSGNANEVSGSANYGTVTGASLIPDSCGIPNSAYNFTCFDYITMAVPGPTGTAARSICFWARSTNTLSGSSFFAVVPFDYGGNISGGVKSVPKRLELLFPGFRDRLWYKRHSTRHLLY